MQGDSNTIRPSLPATLEHVPVAELKPHPKNPRRHSRQQIRQVGASIQRFGFRIPVVADVRNRIVCGHARVAACRDLGLDTVPVVRTDGLTDAQIQAFMIADNRLAELSDWDEALLGEHFQVLSELELDFDLEVTGFDYGDIERLILASEEPNPAPADEPVDGDAVPPTCQPGDLWCLGPHRLLCADSTEASTYASLMGEAQASIVFTDPPYNLPARDIGQVCAARHGDFAVAAGEMSPQAFVEFLAGVFEHLVRCSRAGSIHYVCMDWRHMSEILQAGGQHYSELKNLCVWAKDRAGMGTFYRSQHELVFVFKNGDAPHANHFRLGQHGRYRTNLWRYPAVLGAAGDDGERRGREALQQHPTIKPVGLIEDALRDCSRRGEIVLDAFLGSGSTLIAAEKSRRVCYGIEISPRYLDGAIARWQQWSGQAAVHQASGEHFDQRGQQPTETHHG